MKAYHYQTSTWIRDGISRQIGNADRMESIFLVKLDLVIEILFFVSISKTFSWLVWLFPDPSDFSGLFSDDDDIESFLPMIRKQD